MAKLPSLSSLSWIFFIPIGFIAVAALLSLSGINPFKVYEAIFIYSLTRSEGIAAVYLKLSPVLLCALAFLVAYKIGFFNIGGEGQLFIGSIFAAWVGIFIKGLPPVIHIPLTLGAGFVGGALWGTIAALAKVKLNVNEVLLTLLMNFVGQNIALFLLFGPLQTGSMKGLPYTDTIQPSAFLPRIYGRIHSGFILVIFVVLLLYTVMSRTSFGYKVRCIGKSYKAARYAGISTDKMLILVVGISAGLAGLAGAIEVTGVHGFTFDQITRGFGYQGTITALLSNLNFLIVIPASFLVSLLLAAGESVKIIAGAPEETSHLLLSFVLLGMLAYFYIRERGMR